MHRATVSDVANTCEQQGIAVAPPAVESSASAEEY
jgi:hypothetical protein